MVEFNVNEYARDNLVERLKIVSRKMVDCMNELYTIKNDLSRLNVNDTNANKSKKDECNHIWKDNLHVRNGSQDGYAGKHCVKCYKDWNDLE